MRLASWMSKRANERTNTHKLIALWAACVVCCVCGARIKRTRRQQPISCLFDCRERKRERESSPFGSCVLSQSDANDTHTQRAILTHRLSEHNQLIHALAWFQFCSLAAASKQIKPKPTLGSANSTLTLSSRLSAVWLAHHWSAASNVSQQQQQQQPLWWLVRKCRLCLHCCFHCFHWFHCRCCFERQFNCSLSLERN